MNSIIPLIYIALSEKNKLSVSNPTQNINLDKKNDDDDSFSDLVIEINI